MSFFGHLIDISKGISESINRMPESCQGYRINYNEPYHEDTQI